MEPIVFSRQEFYELIWSDSLLALSKKYNMSDNGLRKACVRMEIPLPDMGYWNKVKAGLEVSKKPLSTQYKGEASIRLSLRQHGNEAGDDLSPQLQLQRKLELDSNLDLKVSKSLKNPDLLVENAEKGLKKWKYKPGELLQSGSGNLDISVSPDFLNRALCVMDVFIKAMKKRGHDIKIKNNKTYLLIAGEEMKMKLSEMQTKDVEEGRFERTGFHTKGKLVFRFERYNVSASISDGKLLVEELLSKLIAKLEILGEQFTEERIKRKKWHDEYEEKRRIEEEQIKRKRTEFKNLRQLLLEARYSEKAEEIRKYITRIEDHSIQKGGISEEMTQWLEWARKKANWIDPLLAEPDEWLDDNDREPLIMDQIQRGHSYPERVDTYSSKKSDWWPSRPWYSKK